MAGGNDKVDTPYFWCVPCLLPILYLVLATDAEYIKGKEYCYMRCPVCKEEKDNNEFYKRTDGKKPSSCKDCSKIKSNQYYAKNKSVINKDRTNSWKSKLKSKYGLSDTEYNKMYNEQNGLCKLCGKFVAYRKLSVDHDHTSGRIRGLLCTSCNVRLGIVENVKSNGILEKMLDYIK